MKNIITKRNASATQRGFNYQTFAGLYLLIDNMPDIKSINIEGKEDIEFEYEDGSKGFYQAKEIKDYSKALSASVVKKALTTLLEDYLSCKNVEDLGIVTNSQIPIGKKLSKELFYPEYQVLYFNDLEKKAQKYLKSKLPKNQLDFNKLSIIKLSYYSANNKSKKIMLERVSDELFDEAQISDKRDRIIDEWITLLLNITEEPNKTLTKEQIVFHTQVISIGQPNFEDFFDNYNINYDQFVYIKSAYNEYLAYLEDDFEIKNRIISDYDVFCKKNYKDKRKIQLLNFVEDESPKIAKNFMRNVNNNQKDVDIFKLIIFQVIISRRKLESIESVFGYEN